MTKHLLHVNFLQHCKEKNSLTQTQITEIIILIFVVANYRLLDSQQLLFAQVSQNLTDTSTQAYNYFIWKFMLNLTLTKRGLVRPKTILHKLLTKTTTTFPCNLYQRNIVVEEVFWIHSMISVFLYDVM